MAKNVMIIGGGGREHALADSLSRSSSIDRIWCVPGNAGTAEMPRCRNIPLNHRSDIIELARLKRVNLVIPGPEAPLAAGIVDDLNRAGIPAFGPTRFSARLEASKGFAKDFMTRNGVSTGSYKRFTNPHEAKAELGRFGFPVVVKADGLAAGKGVLICQDDQEASAAIDSLMVSRDFGIAGEEIVLEECLNGWETSIIGITDGSNFLSFLPAQDHKRAGEGDVGLNTGGMGVIAPHPWVTDSVAQDIDRNILRPTLAGLQREGLGYPGFLFFGVMVTPHGAKVLEYNVRFGDPEAQALLPLLDDDLAGCIDAAMNGGLKEMKLKWAAGATCCVVMAAQGYPGSYETGQVIRGVKEAEAAGCRVYAGGVASETSGEWTTSGGRVLGLTAIAPDLKAAREMAYHGAAFIDFDGGWYRGDIGRGVKT